MSQNEKKGSIGTGPVEIVDPAEAKAQNFQIPEADLTRLLADCVDYVDFYVICDQIAHPTSKKKFAMSQKKCRFCD